MLGLMRGSVCVCVSVFEWGVRKKNKNIKEKVSTKCFVHSIFRLSNKILVIFSMIQKYQTMKNRSDPL